MQQIVFIYLPTNKGRFTIEKLDIKRFPAINFYIDGVPYKLRS